MPEYEAPMDGWLVLRVDGVQMSKFTVESGETIEVDLETEADA